MTNTDIIIGEAIKAGLYTKEQVEAFLKNGLSLPLNTFARWNKLGYKIKKGEKAKLTCLIWNRKKRKSTMNEIQNILEDNDSDISEINDEKDEADFYKTKAYFFDNTQVEKIAV